jgi:hypothetical protein
MKRSLSIAVVLALSLVAGIVQAADKADPTGTWKWTVTRGDNKIDVTLKLKLDGEKLTGTMPGRDGKDIEIEDAKFKDGEISFSVTRTGQNGNKNTSKYNGKIDGDTIKGKVERTRNGEATSTDWEAKREKV